MTLFIGGNDLCQYCNDRVSPGEDLPEVVTKKKKKQIIEEGWIFLMHQLNLPGCCVELSHDITGSELWSRIMKFCEWPSLPSFVSD